MNDISFKEIFYFIVFSIVLMYVIKMTTYIFKRCEISYLENKCLKNKIKYIFVEIVWGIFFFVGMITALPGGLFVLDMYISERIVEIAKTKEVK